ncbi:vesicle transport protein SFT2B-like isoform 2-T2 [Menidia menidia]
MDKLKRVLGGQEDGGGDGNGILERANQVSTLAWGTRMKGFLICFVLGTFCSILGVCLLWIPGFGLPVFAVLYSVGNLSAVGSTMFLRGPWQQMKSMCAKERALATALMLVFLVLTLCSAFWVRPVLRPLRQGRCRQAVLALPVAANQEAATGGQSGGSYRRPIRRLRLGSCGQRPISN